MHLISACSHTFLAQSTQVSYGDYRVSLRSTNRHARRMRTYCTHTHAELGVGPGICPLITSWDPSAVICLCWLSTANQFKRIPFFFTPPSFYCKHLFLNKIILFLQSVLSPPSSHWALLSAVFFMNLAHSLLSCQSFSHLWYSFVIFMFYSSLDSIHLQFYL